ncbi:hypothetical protein [Salsuginibacillus kocurii]|uniref:hypothetical protein n=1 Tax=Salsuginibacillus kocurii TaxID=427078 RepID=UPI00035DE4BC|nr:hypothetical protein [Salsuginibacillus kocurii]
MKKIGHSGLFFVFAVSMVLTLPTTSFAEENEKSEDTEVIATPHDEVEIDEVAVLRFSHF